MNNLVRRKYILVTVLSNKCKNDYIIPQTEQENIVYCFLWWFFGMNLYRKAKIGPKGAEVNVNDLEL